MTAPALERLPTPKVLDLLERELSVAAIEASASRLPARLLDAALHQPLREFLAVPGKAFRARLVELGYRLGGAYGPPPEALPQIVEVLHAGSLIVDDIEDGSTERRGRPCLHVSAGMPLALNAGNWLYFWAFALLEELGLPDEVELAAHRALARTMLECHRGQALDLSVQVTSLPHREVQPVVETIASFKSGSLMGLSAFLGALAAGADRSLHDALFRFGRELGVGLQMLDDLSGITNEARRDKGLEDLRNGRATFVWVWASQGLDDIRYAKLQALARDVRAGRLPPEALHDAFDRRVGDIGRAAVRERLGEALGALRSVVGESPALRALHAEIERLQLSYG